MTDDLLDTYEFPDGFRLGDAEHLDRVEPVDGPTLCVLTKPTTGERLLVHADVVEYGHLNHPAVTGVVGFLAILTGFLGPVVGGYLFAAGASGAVGMIVPAVGGVAAGFAVANVALYRTVLGDWLFRFLEWNDHKHIIMLRGEPA